MNLYCQERGKLRAEKRVKAFTAFFTLQFLGFNYLTYIKYSWDIVEPFVCVTGFIDMLIGSLFYTKVGRIWDIGGITEYYQDKMFKKLVKTQQIDLKKYEYYKAGI